MIWFIILYIFIGVLTWGMVLYLDDNDYISLGDLVFGLPVLIVVWPFVLIGLTFEAIGEVFSSRKFKEPLFYFRNRKNDNG